MRQPETPLLKAIDSEQRTSASAIGELSLADLSCEPLRVLLKIREANLTQNLGSTREKFAVILKRFNRMAFNIGYASERINSVKFALVVAFDEFVSVRESQFTVERIPLQMELFHTVAGGDQFYELLTEMMGKRNPDLDVMTVYFLCLIMGYRGAYVARTDAREELIDGLERVLGLDPDKSWFAFGLRMAREFASTTRSASRFGA